MTEQKSGPEAGFVTININKDKTSGPVRGSVNGRTYEVKVGSDQTVPQWLARSLRDTQIDFTIVAGDLGEEDGEGGAEGSAPSSTVTRTAIRGEDAALDGVGGTPMAAGNLSATPPVLGQVGGAQSGSAGEPPENSGSTVPPVEGEKPANATDVIAGINAERTRRGSEFDADGFIDRNLDDISDEEIAALSPEQREAVLKAENDREQPARA